MKSLQTHPFRKESGQQGQEQSADGNGSRACIKSKINNQSKASLATKIQKCIFMNFLFFKFICMKLLVKIKSSNT